MFNWLDRLITLLVENVFGVSMETHLGGSLHFFFFDTIKIIILLIIMIFTISFIRSFFPPEKTKKTLSRFKGIKGNFAASLLGIVTPFCSCSSVPIFIGFVEGGVPLGLTFSFLITSPIVNEAAFAILLAAFGWKIAMIYVVTGVIVGVTGGLIIDKLKMEKYVEEYVYEIQGVDSEPEKMTFKSRLGSSWQNTTSIIKKIWIFLLIGIGIGAAIHGWVPRIFFRNMPVRKILSP